MCVVCYYNQLLSSNITDLPLSAPLVEKSNNLTRTEKDIGFKMGFQVISELSFVFKRWKKVVQYNWYSFISCCRKAKVENIFVPVEVCNQNILQTKRWTVMKLLFHLLL